ncbi:MAG: NAD(P)/FAD-dependent oxidoreductase [Weeksellaceae bacterium]|nr:NAD(P)/FAD-dependent oxidoreductase [Weeksellaceae bacterium]
MHHAGDTQRKKVVVVGGGFAGLEIIKQLSKYSEYDVLLVDRNNYNFFPPLLYQVAAGFMEPSAISYPFRKILRKYKTHFRMGQLEQILPEENKIVLENGEVSYDLLILCTGSVSNFFGNENVSELSMPMKTISDALTLRNSYLIRLERASRTSDPVVRRKLLSYVIAGAGPTGVELSGIFAEMRRSILKKDYPELNPEDLGEIYLIDGQSSVLAPMSRNSQLYTYKKLKELGVKIKLDTQVKDFKDDVVYLSDGNTIASRNLIWTAGVTVATAQGMEKEDVGGGNRYLTNRFNKLLRYDNIFALGDNALIVGDPDYPKGHPQLAQPAIQQARNLGKNLGKTPDAWEEFSYSDKGSMAIIGRNKAVADIPKPKFFLKGFTAWFIWVFVHIMSLVNFTNRLHALYNWTGYYFKEDQSFRMIIRPRK